MSKEPQEYSGKEITIRFDGKACIHSRNCVLGLPDVFQANVPGEWIKPDNASVEDLIAVARSCPSGAITYERHDGGAEESAPDVNVIRVLENGPLAVTADLHIEGHEPRTRATLCRCGASKNKPYCDGSHTEAGFTATGELPTEDSEPLEVRNGRLEITPFPNGPLGFSGNVEICAGTGRTLNRTTKGALCRCGESKNKPYCDGSHNAAGFIAE
jgi:CDGSH-type Zn-finger protein/uncharacterized Fe-S cluster protein YjdI